MKKVVALISLIIAFPALSTEFKVLQYAQSKELAALEAVNSDVSIYKIGQEINFTFGNGSSCLLTISKTVPEKSRLFVNTAKCSHTN